MSELVKNPFKSEQHGQGNAIAQSEQQKAIAEVQAALIAARTNPRDVVAATDRIINACARIGLAEYALYSYPRGGSEVSGPSIRLAEVIAQNWGNIQFGFRELSRGIDQRGIGYSEVEAYAWDIETNTRKPIYFRVPHFRDTQGGGYKLKSERDIYEMVANMSSRRIRNCILSIVPGDVVELAVKQCEKTLSTSVDVTQEGIKKMLRAFHDEFGVTKEHIEAHIQRRIETIHPAQMIALKKIYASLRDGMSIPEKWFKGAVSISEGAKKKTRSDSAKDKVKSNRKQKTSEVKMQPRTKDDIIKDAVSATDAVLDVLLDEAHALTDEQDRNNAVDAILDLKEQK